MCYTPISHPHEILLYMLHFQDFHFLFKNIYLIFKLGRIQLELEWCQLLLDTAWSMVSNLGARLLLCMADSYMYDFNIFTPIQWLPEDSQK